MKGEYIKSISGNKEKNIDTQTLEIILEKLKQNQMVRHVQEENRREQNELDEMATLRYRHNPL